MLLGFRYTVRVPYSRTETTLAIAKWVKEHPYATQAQTQLELEKQIQLFREKIVTLWKFYSPFLIFLAYMTWLFQFMYCLEREVYKFDENLFHQIFFDFGDLYLCTRIASTY
jgi:hypothetical protein